MRAALAWNIFRTLSLIDPSRWLRQLHARTFGFDERYRAPEWLEVRLWPSAPGSSAAREAQPIDVLLESETIVWGFLTAFEGDVIVGAHDMRPDPVLRGAGALAELAGGRKCFVGLLASGETTAPLGTGLIRRYAAAPDLLRSRLPHVRGGAHVDGLGMATWTTCATVLEECARSPMIGQPERLAAARCLRWLATCGVGPLQQ
jgi:hypothetical protein